METNDGGLLDGEFPGEISAPTEAPTNGKHKGKEKKKNGRPTRAEAKAKAARGDKYRFALVTMPRGEKEEVFGANLVPGKQSILLRIGSNPLAADVVPDAYVPATAAMAPHHVSVRWDADKTKQLTVYEHGAPQGVWVNGKAVTGVYEGEGPFVISIGYARNKCDRRSAGRGCVFEFVPNYIKIRDVWSKRDPSRFRDVTDVGARSSIDTTLLDEYMAVLDSRAVTGPGDVPIVVRREQFAHVVPATPSRKRTCSEMEAGEGSDAVPLPTGAFNDDAVATLVEAHECGVCMSLAVIPQILACSHMICLPCLLPAVNITATCPQCRAPLTAPPLSPFPTRQTVLELARYLPPADLKDYNERLDEWNKRSVFEANCIRQLKARIDQGIEKGVKLGQLGVGHQPQVKDSMTKMAHACVGRARLVFLQAHDLHEADIAEFRAGSKIARYSLERMRIVAWNLGCTDARALTRDGLDSYFAMFLWASNQ
jgi:hypothetical protein